jgi:two-component system sensor histidine kinase YesM
MSLKSDGSNIWIAENEDILGIDNVPYLYVCRTIRSTNQFRTLGQLIIQMPVDSFEGIFRQTSIVKGEYYSIIDKNGKVLYNTHDKALIGKPSDADILSAISSNQGGYKIIRKENSSYLVVYSKYSSNDWNVVHVLPLDIVLSSARKVSNITLVIMLLSLIILSPLQLYLSRNISLPIKKLKNSVESFGNGNLDMRIKIDRLDEIGHLQLSFNKMAKDINSLLVKTEEKNKQLGLAELNMIKYQINPHFLYNSLDSINWMAQSAGNEDIEEMVTALARFFRIGLSKGKEFYKIGDELEHARQYLLINKIRFKDSFTFEVESEQDVLEYSTIRILLQPIVENAVKYGINKMDQTGHIQVTAVKADNAIIMKVSDNGAGIPYERLEIIRNVLSRRTQIDNVSTDGFGLFNVNQRIWMQFGEGYGIEIDSIKGKGTDVSIKIPLLD